MFLRVISQRGFRIFQWFSDNMKIYQSIEEETLKTAYIYTYMAKIITQLMQFAFSAKIRKIFKIFFVSLLKNLFITSQIILFYRNDSNTGCGKRAFLETRVLKGE